MPRHHTLPHSFFVRLTMRSASDLHESIVVDSSAGPEDYIRKVAAVIARGEAKHGSNYSSVEIFRKGEACDRLVAVAVPTMIFVDVDE